MPHFDFSRDEKSLKRERMARARSPASIRQLTRSLLAAKRVCFQTSSRLVREISSAPSASQCALAMVRYRSVPALAAVSLAGDRAARSGDNRPHSRRVKIRSISLMQSAFGRSVLLGSREVCLSVRIPPRPACVGFETQRTSAGLRIALERRIELWGPHNRVHPAPPQRLMEFCLVSSANACRRCVESSK